MEEQKVNQQDLREAATFMVDNIIKDSDEETLNMLGGKEKFRTDSINNMIKKVNEASLEEAQILLDGIKMQMEEEKEQKLQSSLEKSIILIINHLPLPTPSQ